MRFQLVDRYESIDPGRRAVGLKAVSGTEEILRDHFPGNPVFPGVLILESLAQTAGGLIALSTDFESFALMSLVQDVKYRDFVRPGRLIRCEVEVESLDRGSARVAGRAFCEGREIARARIGFVLKPLGEIIPEPYQAGWIAHIRSWAAGVTPGAVGP